MTTCRCPPQLMRRGDSTTTSRVPNPDSRVRRRWRRLQIANCGFGSEQRWSCFLRLPASVPRPLSCRAPEVPYSTSRLEPGARLPGSRYLRAALGRDRNLKAGRRRGCGGRRQTKRASRGGSQPDVSAQGAGKPLQPFRDENGPSGPGVGIFFVGVFQTLPVGRFRRTARATDP